VTLAIRRGAKAVARRSFQADGSAWDWMTLWINDFARDSAFREGASHSHQESDGQQLQVSHLRDLPQCGPKTHIRNIHMWCYECQISDTRKNAVWISPKR
jgi:hypothetical protein